MNVLWFSWKDTKHPLAGGAELVSGEIMKRLARDGHEVRLITARPRGGSKLETEAIDGVTVYRLGNRYTVYIKAFFLFRKQMKKWPDLVIDEMNTIPFGCGLYTRKRSVLLTYQLARKVWFYQLPFPFSVVGYIIEPIYLLLLSKAYGTVLTESESTRSELKKFGFSRDKVRVFRVGMSIKPLGSLRPKASMNTVLVLGALRPMKRTLDAIKAFELARDSNDALELVVAGDNSGSYAAKVTNYVKGSRHVSAIKIVGHVTSEERLKLMADAAVLLVTSVKEGWGLIVTEANSQGTPAIAYTVSGLSDSVQNQKTGLLVKCHPAAMGQAINSLLRDPSAYEQLRLQAWQWSHEFTFENSYADFKHALELPD